MHHLSLLLMIACCATLGSRVEAAPLHPAPEQPCFCDDRFDIGETVHACIDNPSGAANLPKNACGMVSCGYADKPDWVLVTWFNWAHGDSDAGRFCTCGFDRSRGKSWWVRCHEIERGCPPRARGACCLGDRCGVTTQLRCVQRGGMYMGDGITCDEACDCGLDWAWQDMDGDGDVGFEDFLMLIERWGDNGPRAPLADLNRDCRVDIRDLLILFRSFGPMPERGACCLDGLCSMRTEAACARAGGVWWGGGSDCRDVACVDADVLGDALCNCNGVFRVGDRVTMLRRVAAPGFVPGMLGTVVCADDIADGAWPGVVTVLLDEWVEQRPEVRADPTRAGTWLCDCGWEPFLERWSTTRVHCQDLLHGEQGVDAVGACCLEGVSCRASTPQSCAAWGGAYAGDGTTCQMLACTTPIECACNGTWSIGDQVRLNRNVNWAGHLRTNITGIVFGGDAERPEEVLVYFDTWRGGQVRPIEHGCGFVDDASDRLDYVRLAWIPCDALDVRGQ